MALLDFVVACDLAVIYSIFKEKEDHLVTFRSGSCRTRSDYFLIRVNHWRLCKDCNCLLYTSDAADE